MNTKQRLLFICDDVNSPTGGIKQIYRQVDVLNANGFNAFVLHRHYGFQCTWFKNKTQVVYNYPLFDELDIFLKTKAKERGILGMLLKIKSFYKRNIVESLLKIKNKSKNTVIHPTDIIVFPEVYGPKIVEILKGNKKVIYNQGAYQTFFHHDLNLEHKTTPYLDQEVIATLVNSENAKEYINYVFPNMEVQRVRYGIDSNIFFRSVDKKKKIAFMPRRLSVDLAQVINILKFRGILENWELVEIHNMNEQQVANSLRDCAIFLSFSINEGFGMPPAEAMACGCIVVGYPGKGGKEFFNEDFCYPVEDRDVISFAKTLEKVITEYDFDNKPFIEKGKKASEFILEEYSMEQEVKTIVDCWNKILE